MINRFQVSNSVYREFENLKPKGEMCKKLPALKIKLPEFNQRSLSVPHTFTIHCLCYEAG